MWVVQPFTVLFWICRWLWRVTKEPAPDVVASEYGFNAFGFTSLKCAPAEESGHISVTHNVAAMKLIERVNQHAIRRICFEFFV